MPDATGIDRIIADIRYLVLATVDPGGSPWVTPLFFAPLGTDRVCWVSSSEARHSRNIAMNPSEAITVFDSSVAVGKAEAAYFEGHASPAPQVESDEALVALNSRLPEPGWLTDRDLQPRGGLTVYRARVRRRYALVRAGNDDPRASRDMTVEV